MDKAIEMGKRYNKIEAQIKALEKEKTELKEQMPKIYFIEGTGYQGIERGVHFVGDTKEACIAWLEREWSDFRLINSTQILKVGSSNQDKVAANLFYATPDNSSWRKLVAQKSKQDQ